MCDPPLRLLHVVPLSDLTLALQLNITDYWDVYSRVLDKYHGGRSLRRTEAMPSSGLLGVPCPFPLPPTRLLQAACWHEHVQACMQGKSHLHIIVLVSKAQDDIIKPAFQQSQ